MNPPRPTPDDRPPSHQRRMVPIHYLPPAIVPSPQPDPAILFHVFADAFNRQDAQRLLSLCLIPADEMRKREFIRRRTAAFQARMPFGARFIRFETHGTVGEIHVMALHVLASTGFQKEWEEPATLAVAFRGGGWLLAMEDDEGGGLSQQERQMLTQLKSLG